MLKKLLLCLMLVLIPAAVWAVGGWEPAMSSDGQMIAFTSGPPHGIPNIWIMDADGRNQRQLTTLGGRAPQWIPNSHKLLFVTLRTGKPSYQMLDLDSPNPTETAMPGLPVDAQEIVWSHDGAMMAYSRLSSDGRARDLWTAFSDGSNSHGITTKFWVRQYVWSPDSKQVAFVVGRAIGSSLWLADTGTGKISLLYQGFCNSPSYSPDGKYLAFAVPSTKEGHRFVVLETATGKKIPVPVKSFDGRVIKWSPDSTSILFSSETMTDAAIWKVGVNGRSLIRITPQDMQAFNPSFSPDGRNILFSATKPDSQGADIYVCGADASVPYASVIPSSDKPADESGYKRLTKSSGSSFEPVWSPDGRHMAAAVMDRGMSALYIIENGRRKPQKLIDIMPDQSLMIAWSPDSRSLAVTQGSVVQLFDPTEGKSIIKFNAQGETSVTWSADSKSIFFTAWKEGKGGISSFTIGDKSPKQITSGSMKKIEPSAKDSADMAPAEPHSGLGMSGPIPIEQDLATAVPVSDIDPACSPDGKTIAFIRDNQIWVMNPDGKNEQQLTKFSEPSAGTIDILKPVWSPDGKTIAFQLGRTDANGLTWELWIAHTDGSVPKSIVSEHSDSEYDYLYRNYVQPPAFTDDGNDLIFTSIAEGLAKVARVSIDGGKVQDIINGPSSFCSIAANGRLAYLHFDGDGEQAVVKDLKSGREQKVSLPD